MSRIYTYDDKVENLHNIRYNYRGKPVWQRNGYNDIGSSGSSYSSSYRSSYSSQHSQYAAGLMAFASTPSTYHGGRRVGNTQFIVPSHW